MQRGGFDIIPIKDSDFKYTIDPDRILWTKNVFPIAEYIIQAIQNIPWSTYTFEGTSIFWKPSGKTFVSEELEVSTIPSTQSKYYYFGGSVFEIMNKLYTRQGMPNLHSYVDPTGDLDVILILPQVALPEGKSSDSYLGYFFRQLPYQSSGLQRRAPQMKSNASETGGLNANILNQNNFLNNAPAAEPLELIGCPNNVFTGANATLETVERDPRRYSAYIEHYTDWVMECFAENLNKYKRGGLFDLLFGNTVKFNLENDAEGRYADRVFCIGNIKLVRSYIPYMGLIKIQLIAKFKGMTRSDHICEFLLQMPSQPNSTLTLRRYESAPHEYHVLKGFPLSNFGELVRGNLDSLINRHSLHETTGRHKFYNHVGRMQYMHDFFNNNLNPYYETDAAKLTLSKKDYAELGNQMAKFSFYIAENFFSKEIFDFDYKRRYKGQINVPGMNELRIALLKSLIGSYPKFLLRKKSVGRGYKSPFKTIFFSYGDRIQARTEFVLAYLFEKLDELPRSVEKQIGYEGFELDTLHLYLFLRYLGYVNF